MLSFVTESRSIWLSLLLKYIFMIRVAYITTEIVQRPPLTCNSAMYANSLCERVIIVDRGFSVRWVEIGGVLGRLYECRVLKFV